MIEQFRQYITRECNVLFNSSTLLAVSGGIDSIVMLDLAYHAGLDFAIVHCNFKLRDNESDLDSEFVKELAQKYGRPVYVKDFDTSMYAVEHGISVQMAARELRYNWFAEIRQQIDADHVATAHNRDDVAETFFLNLSRGTGIRGLTGINPVREFYIRPLLFASRDEIVDYCNEKKLVYREDSSNVSTKYKRNKIRHEVIPLLEELNPSFKKKLADSMNYLSDALGFIEPQLDRIKESLLHYDQNSIRLSVKELLDQKSPKLILHEILHEFGYNSMQVKDIFDQLGGESGKLFYSKTHELLIDRDQLFIQPGKKRERKFFYIDDYQGKMHYPVHIELKIKENGSGFEISSSRDIAYLDLDKLSFPLIMRTWKKGDYFMPLGMKNMVKLSDFYINNKLSLFEKENTWLLVTNNKIAWIVGRRIDERFKITNNTKRILEVRLVR